MADQVPVYIKEIGIVDYRCFSGENKFSFVDEHGDWCRWTVFLGDNNTGKTNLLKAIASMEPDYNSEKDIYYPLIPFCLDDQQAYRVGINVLHPTSEYFPVKNKKGIYDISYDSPVKSSDDIFDMSYLYSKEAIEHTPSSLSYFDNLSIYGYGVVRDIENKGITSNRSKYSNTDNLFQNSKLINFEDWLFQLDYTARNEKTTRPKSNISAYDPSLAGTLKKY